VPDTFVARERVLAFRLARHHVTERAADAATAAFPALQDTPPGAAATALAARADVAPEAFDELVVVPSLRGAATAVALEDLAIFTTGLEPADEDEARHLMGNAWKPLEQHSALEALDVASEAVRDVLADGPLIKTEFHRSLTERVPEDLRWWCKGCDEHHVHPSLWRATGIRGVLAVVDRDGAKAYIVASPEYAAKDRPEIAIETDNIHELYNEIKARRPRMLHPNGNVIQKKPRGALEFAVLDKTTVCVIFRQW